MKSFFQILVCCFANAALAMCSSQADGEPVIYIVDYGGLPWKFVVTNNVAEIRDASYDNRRVSLYNFELYTPAIPRSTPGKITTPAAFFDGDNVLRFRVVKIGDTAFRGCTNITAVSISPGITEVGVRAFERCRSLREISIPDGVQSIGSRSFWYCGALKEITIPDSVQTIGWGSFLKCTSLERVRWPDHIADIP